MIFPFFKFAHAGILHVVTSGSAAWTIEDGGLVEREIDGVLGEFGLEVFAEVEEACEGGLEVKRE